MSDGYSLDGYIEVPDRIVEFKKEHPQGSLQGEWELREIGGDIWIVYIAKAYRSEEDPRPGVGMAWEPFPGKTPYTKDSELMNAETSAWGRAIVALGFLAKGEKVASANEVRSRSNGDAEPAKPTDKQLDFLEKLLKKQGADDIPTIRAYCAERLNKDQVSKGIDKLTGDGAGQVALDISEAAEKWQQGQQEISDVPPDTEGLKQPETTEQPTLG